MVDFLSSTIEANREIRELILNNLGENLHQAISLGAGGDISIKIDIVAEEIFVKYLAQFGNINSEECGFIDNNSDYDIVIDPIDGSNNFLCNIPFYGTSVALKYKGKCIIAVIVNLANEEVFIKDEKRFEKGSLNNLIFRKINNNCYSNFGLFERAYCSEKTPEILKKYKIKYRSMGALALSLAYAHDVDFVLFEGKMRAYDIEAGLYMCEDLNIIKTSNLLLVSKDKEIFDKISQFIL
jgi:myo-inositol-1(or 4)-monophosphatase